MATAISLTPADTKLAQESSRQLLKFLGRYSAGSSFPDFKLRVQAE